MCITYTPLNKNLLFYKQEGFALGFSGAKNHANLDPIINGNILGFELKANGKACDVNCVNRVLEMQNS